MALIEARNIHKTYTNGKNSLDVLKGIDISFEKGGFIVIVGPSGAGKSTLLHILGGLDAPTQGKVIFEQDDLYSLSDEKIASIRNGRFGFVFQFYHLLPEFTVLENVLMPTWLAHKADGYTKDRAAELLIEIGLGERMRHFPNQLSGGERQRAAIVRGLINNPQVLFCDEPTGNLDSKTGEDVIEIIRRVSLENKMTVILVTHNIELAETADRVYHLKDGFLFN
ncbi:MAG: ABC transporter ATP-binding protein [Candidatus Omnitrophica bacterium]|nr:ABC transporter ATP-binding protein [Candidatus Omnitrophota bacterium]